MSTSQHTQHGKQHQRQRRRAQRTLPRVQQSPTAPPQRAPFASAELGGMTPAQVQMMGGLLAQDLRTATLRAQARATGGSPSASVMGHFLAPLTFVYQGMDMVSAAARALATPPMVPACTKGCFACCRLYVEIGPWEAFGIADYLTQVIDAGHVTREVVLTRLQEEVTRFAQHGDTGAMRWCAFLTHEGSCGIYPARPASCRSYYSRSRAACEQHFAQPTLGKQSPPTVVRTPDQGITAQLSLAETLATAQPPFPPLDVPSVYEMQSMVLRILETPGALVRYLAGEDIFQGCLRHSPESELRRVREHLLQLQVPVPPRKESVW